MWNSSALHTKYIILVFDTESFASGAQNVCPSPFSRSPKTSVTLFSLSLLLIDALIPKIRHAFAFLSFILKSLLFSADKVENTSEDRVRKVKEDFEKRLASLKTELRRLNASKREHSRMQKEQQRREMQLTSLHRELEEMKRLKVQLLKKVKEEAKRARQLEIAHDREVAQLRREKRMKDNTIRTLETEKRQRENVLRRKHEEVGG